VPANLATEQLDRTAGRLQEAEQDSNERCLACSVRTEKRVKLSPTDLEIHIVEGDLAAEPPCQVAG
jgi:hypothetical protein